MLLITLGHLLITLANKEEIPGTPNPEIFMWLLGLGCGITGFLINYIIRGKDNKAQFDAENAKEMFTLLNNIDKNLAILKIETDTSSTGLKALQGSVSELNIRIQRKELADKELQMVVEGLKKRIEFLETQKFSARINRTKTNKG